MSAPAISPCVSSTCGSTPASSASFAISTTSWSSPSMTASFSCSMYSCSLSMLSSSRWRTTRGSCHDGNQQQAARATPWLAARRQLTDNREVEKLREVVLFGVDNRLIAGVVADLFHILERHAHVAAQQPGDFITCDDRQ